MDFMKVLDQTVREIKREVNLKVLKVPEIEQKVLDATSDEPWGPHGSTLSEIAQATKKYTECKMIMNVLWNRLTDTGPNWRHVYKALTVIEYLIANGSERAVDDILEHSFKIASISGFEHMEPNGKDAGINVRKKVETISALLKDKEKIRQVREKAAANRDKYIGLSSTGMTCKSSRASTGGTGFLSDQYGSLSGRRKGDSFEDGYRDKEYSEIETDWVHGKSSSLNKSNGSPANGGGSYRTMKEATHKPRDQDSLMSSTSEPLNKPGTVPLKSSSPESGNDEDDFDDFDPRGSFTTGSARANFNQVDLLGDLMDVPTSIPTESATVSNVELPEIDLFADAAFISSTSHTKTTTSSCSQGNIDLFGSQPAFPASFPSQMDFFAAPDSSGSESKSSQADTSNTSNLDPFAAVPLNNFEGSDLFGAFSSHSDPVRTEPSQNFTKNPSNLDNDSSIPSKPALGNNAFQVKSGIWADSLSRGLIDLNITASKKTSLADVGIVGRPTDDTDKQEKGPPASAYMGRARRPGSGLVTTGGFPSAIAGRNAVFPAFAQPEFGDYK